MEKRAKITAICNQKGGVGKTVTTVNLGIGLAREAMLDYLEAAQWQNEVTPDLFENLVERITVASAEEVKFRLLNGLELSERLV